MADLETPTLELPYANPDDPLGGAAASMGALALALENMLGAQAQFSDASWPVAASGATVETAIDRITVAAQPYPRKIITLAMVYVTYTQAAEIELRWYGDASIIGRSRLLHVANGATDRYCLGAGTLAADTGMTLELRVAENTGTGSMSTSVSSGLHKSAALLIPDA